MRAAAEHLANWPSPAWTALHRALPKPDRTLALRPFLADYYRARLARALLEEERALALSMRGVVLSALGRRRLWQQHRKPLSSTAGWPPNSPTPSSLTWQIA